MQAKFSRQLAWPLLAGVVVALVLVYWRGFFRHHAAMIGIAVMALVYSGVGTVKRLRSLHGERRDFDE